MPAADIIQKASLAESVSRAITQDIVSGRYGPGDKLPTGNSLAEEYRVSLTVIREAISGLRADGLIETRQGAGVYVSHASTRQPFRIPDSLSEEAKASDKIFELRQGAEVTAATLAAERRTEAQMDALTRAHEIMVNAVRTQDSAIKEDLDFHRAIAAATGNELFVGFINFLANHISDSIKFSLRGTPDWWGDKLIAEHQRIYDAILAKNTLAAHDAMSAHMQNCKNRAH